MTSKHTNENFVSLLSSFSNHYVESESAPNKNFHIHDSYELTLILSDGVELDVNDESYAVPCGSLLIFNTMDLHRVRFLGEGLYKRWVCQFKQSEIDALGKMAYKLLRCFFIRSSDKPNLLALSPEQTELVKGLYLTLQGYMQKRSSFMYKELKCVSLAQFLININDIYFEKKSESLTTSSKDYSSVYKSILYIQENVANGITRGELAKYLGTDERRLCESFKNVTGLTTAQYILNFKLTLAKSLLAQGLGVTEVCEKTGFDNWSNFSRTFKTHVGMSPKKYQMENK